jgi:hypothetical protein
MARALESMGVLADVCLILTDVTVTLMHIASPPSLVSPQHGAHASHLLGVSFL